MKNAKVAIIDGFHVVALGTESDAGAWPLAKGNKQEWMSRSRVFAGLSWHCQGLEVSSQKQVMILYAALALSLNLRIMRGPVKVDGRFDMNPGSSITLPNNVPNWGTM